MSCSSLSQQAFVWLNRIQHLGFHLFHSSHFFCSTRGKVTCSFCVSHLFLHVPPIRRDGRLGDNFVFDVAAVDFPM